MAGHGYGRASVPTSVPKPTRSVPQIPIADDIIAIENAASLVAAQFHRHAFGDAGADHVPDGGSAKVVRDAAWAAGGDPSAAPRVVEAAGGDSTSTRRSVFRRRFVIMSSAMEICGRLRVGLGTLVGTLARP